MPPSASASEAGPVAGRETVFLFLLLAAALAWRLACFVGVNGGDDPHYSEAALVPTASLTRDLSQGGPTVFRVGLLIPTRVAYALFGIGERAAAVYPLLCSLGTVVLAWWLGRLLLGPLAGGLAGTLVAFCPHQAGWSSVLSPDIPMGFWLSLSAVLLFRPVSTARSILVLSACSGCAWGLAVATRETAFALLPLGLAAAWAKGAPGRRTLAAMAFLGGGLLGLWVLTMDGRMFSGLSQYLFGDYLDRSDPLRHRLYLADLSISSPQQRWLDAPRMLLPWDYRFHAFAGIATAGLAVGAWILARRRGALAWVAAWAWGYALFLALGASPRSPAAPLLVVQPRYLEPALVPLAVLTAWLLMRLSHRRWLLAAWGLYLLYSGWLWAVQERSFCRPYREVAVWLELHPEERTVCAEVHEAALLNFLMGHPSGRRVRGFPEGAPWPSGALAVAGPGSAHPGWTRVRSWNVPAEPGPRQRLNRLLGRPVDLPSTELAAYRVP